MTRLLRFLAILNAAVWCGAAVFLLAGLPAVFSPELKRLLTDAGVGFAAERIVGRYFILQYFCAGIALLLLVFENMCAARRTPRISVALVLGLLAIALAGGLVAQPRMTRLHEVKYFGRTIDERARAGREFAAWHGTSEAVNLLSLAGLVFFLWIVTMPPEPARSGYFPKIRG